MSVPDRDHFRPTKRQWLGFWAMIAQQTQNAFNDKMAQFILIPLGGAVGVSVESGAGLMISLPFVLLAPLAGWVSDRFSKRVVLFFCAVLQFLVLSWICLAVWIGSMGLALCGFFALAVQSAFFSPAKMGLNKELLGSRHLGFATAVQQMLAMLAILAGQIVAGKLYDDRLAALAGRQNAEWQAAFGPLLILAACSLPALLMAWVLPAVRAQSAEPFRAALLVGHFRSLRDLWSDRRLRMASFGVAFFWGFAAYLNLWSVKLAKALSDGGEGFGTLSSLFMAAASLGMAGGFGFASWLLRRSVQLGWVPLAAIMMTFCSLGLAAIPIGDRDAFLRFVTTDMNRLVSTVLVEPGCFWFLLVLGLLAFFSSLFLAPLNAWMQDFYPPEKRGELQSAVNLQDCFAVIAGVLAITGLEWLATRAGMDPLVALRPHMWMVALFCLLAAAFIIRVLPADFMRLCCVSLTRSLHKVETLHRERIPAHGGVLLLPNHVTYADSFYLSSAIHRPLRFVMDEAFTRFKAIRIFTRIFDTVNIRRDQPIEAIRTVIDGLGEGGAMVLFPEGRLTRTGMLCPLQRGFELIARKAKHPIVPVWMDGLWGTMPSFEGGRFFHKRPRKCASRLICAIGDPIAPSEAKTDVVYRALLRASAEALTHRFSGTDWARRIPKGPRQIRTEFSRLSAGDRRAMWANGHQIGMVGSLPWGRPWFALRDDPCVTELLGLFAAFPALFQTPPTLLEGLDSSEPGVWVGGAMLRACMEKFQITSELVFHDFSDAATTHPLERAGITHCPALAMNGRVVAMSMPDPCQGDDGFPPQLGRGKYKWGRILPGWAIQGSDNSLSVCGVAALAGLELPAHAATDEDGFLVNQAALPKPPRYGRRG